MNKFFLFPSTAALILAAHPCLAQGAGNAPSMRNGLPPTMMDSFVYSAGGSGELIYGDEGVWDIPPYFGFDYGHRINAGITGTNDKGLTTGHGSYMPDAWGADEFLAPPGEWSRSGSTGGNPQQNNADLTLNYLDQQAAIQAQQILLEQQQAEQAAQQQTQQQTPQQAPQQTQQQPQQQTQAQPQEQPTQVSANLGSSGF